MENKKIYRTLFLIDSTQNYTSNFYIFEFVKIALFQANGIALSPSALREAIAEISGLLYTEEEILRAISRMNNRSVEKVNDEFLLTSSGEYDVRTNREINNLTPHIGRFLDEVLPKSELSKKQIEDLVQGFIYEKFNENLAQLTNIFDNNTSEEDFCGERTQEYSDEEKDVINSFLNWDNFEKNKCVYSIIAKSFDYCMINCGCKNPKFDPAIFHFYLDTNILLRLVGFNNESRQNSTRTFIEKCLAVKMHVVVSNFVIEECNTTIDNHIEEIIARTSHMDGLISPSAMGFAEESSINLDFYTKYYNWCKEGNKHRDYDGFKKRIKDDLNDWLLQFERDDNNISYQVSCPDSYERFYHSLYVVKQDKFTTRTDINSILLLHELREKNNEEYFLISSDSTLINWCKDIFVSQKPFAELPSVWLSVILKYTGRAKDSDYTSFCQFIHLPIKPDTYDIKKKIDIKAAIMSGDFSTKVKQHMLEDIKNNYGEFKDYSVGAIVHMSYTKAEEKIRKEGFDAGVQSAEAQFDKIKKEYEDKIDTLGCNPSKEEHENSISKAREDGYKRGRNAAIKETAQKKAKNNKRIHFIFWTVIAIISILLIVTIIANWNIIPDSKLFDFFSKNEVRITWLGIPLDVLLIIIKKICKNLLPTDENTIYNKLGGSDD